MGYSSFERAFLMKIEIDGILYEYESRCVL